MFKPITREFFLRHRAVMTAKAKQSPVLIVVDAGDEVICDVCNSTVEENPIWVNSYGLYCYTCRENTSVARTK